MTSSSNWIPRLRVGWLAIGALGLVGLATWAGRDYLRYRRAQGRPGSGDGPQVLIQAPSPGSARVEGEGVLVQTLAFGPGPIDTTELWFDGELLGKDRAPAGGLNPWITSFQWTPPAPGDYSLVARVVDADGLSAVSPSVVLQVEQGPEGEESSGGQTSVIFPSAGGIGAPIDIPGDDSESGPATPWMGSLGNWLQSLVVNKPPGALFLAVDRDGCDAALRIRDLSDNEEGFRIYRNQRAGWEELAVLGSSAPGWLTYTDADLSGSVTYYAAAFNSQGETAGNIAGVHFPAEDCPPTIAASIDAKVLQLTEWVNSPDVDRAYCYQSFDQVAWMRLPEVGFLSPGGGGNFEPLPFLSTLPESGGLPPLDMWLECWGWAGGTLQFLGKTFLEGIDLGQAAEWKFTGDDFSGAFGLGDDYVLYGDFPTPTSARMPYLDDWVDYRRSECEDHIQPAGAWRCNPLPTFNEGPTGPNPQPYILWDYLENVCPAGSYEDCLSISAWTFYAQSLDMELAVQLQERFEEVALLDFSWLSGESSEAAPMGFNYVINHYIDASLPMYRALPFPCAGDRTYRARLALVEPGSNPGDHPPMAGPWSSGVYGVLCRQPLGDKIWMEATFHHVTLNHVEDCDLECEDAVETFGYFHAMPGGPEGTRPIGHLTMGWCSSWGSGFGQLGSCLAEHTVDLGNGGHALVDDAMCFENVLMPGFDCGSPFAGFVPGNNKIFFQVREGEAVELMASISDRDDRSGSDTVCWARVWTPPRTLEEWAAVGGEVIPLSQSMAENDNADCRVDVTLRAVSGPPPGWP